MAYTTLRRKAPKPTTYAERLEKVRQATQRKIERLKANPPKPKKRTALAQVSPKRRKENAEYSRLRVVFLTAHPHCEACAMLHPRSPKPQHPATEIHHMQGRGPNLNRTETWAAVCRDAHLEIHARPNRARRLGLLK